VRKFDPKRDAAADIQAAIAEAQKTGKRVILDIGGDWCQYCHQMDQFFQDHPDVFQLREKNFVTVLIFYSSDNKNEKALSRYSKVLGIPHFFVLGVTVRVHSPDLHRNQSLSASVHSVPPREIEWNDDRCRGGERKLTPVTRLQFLKLFTNVTPERVLKCRIEIGHGARGGTTRITARAARSGRGSACG